MFVFYQQRDSNPRRPSEKLGRYLCANNDDNAEVISLDKVEI